MSKRFHVNSPEFESSENMSKRSNASESVMGEVATAIQSFLNSKEASQMFENLFSKIIGSIKGDVDHLKEENNLLKETVRKLDQKVEAMEDSQDGFLQEQKKCSIVVINIWEEKQAEVPFLIFKNFCQKELQYNLQEENIVSCYRIGKRSSDGKVRPILINLKSLDTKKAIVDSKRESFKRVKEALSRDKTNFDLMTSMAALKSVYLNDDLTKLRRFIFAELKSLKNEKIIEDCWVYDGRINFKTLDGKVVKNVSRQTLRKLKVERSSDDNAMDAARH